MKREFRVVGLVLLAALLGCSTPPDADFTAVQKAVAQRSGQQPQWRGYSAADQAVDALVRQALQEPLTLAQAVRISLLNNRNLQATYQELGIARADWLQAGLLRNPLLHLDLRWATQGAGMAWELEGAYGLIELLTLPLRKKLATAQLEAVKLEVAAAALELIADVQVAFVELQRQEQLLELRRTSAQAATASAEAARRLRQAGNLTALALAQEEAQAQEAQLQVTQARLEALDAHERLTTLLGLAGGDEDFQLVPSLPALPAVEPDLGDLEPMALFQRADLAAARGQMQALGRRLGLARWEFFDDAEAGVHYDEDVDGAATVGPTITFPLPLFDWGQGRAARARAQLQQAQQRYRAQVTAARSQVRRARARLLAARQQVERYQSVILPLQETILQETQRQYNAMQLGVFALLQAKRQQLQRQQDSVQRLGDYWIARAELERAVGGRLPGPTAATQPAATQPAQTQSAPVPSAAPASQQPHHHGAQP